MVGSKGSRTHQHTAISTVLTLLDIKKGDRILDLGCGQGVLAPEVNKAGADYFGIDASKNMIDQALSRHKRDGNFFVGDVAKLLSHQITKLAPFSGCVFMLSIEDIRFAESAISQASSLLFPNGKVVIFMLHPAFRIPRQSGWGLDPQRKLIYRRVDSYLSTLDVPMRTHYTTGKVLTRSFHRPISYYVNALAKADFNLHTMLEIPEDPGNSTINKAQQKAFSEIPHFLAIKAIKKA